jgi:cytochrome oxidase Cu insertion factor (SCO1/SenC/PrrC family)
MLSSAKAQRALLGLLAGLLAAIAAVLVLDRAHSGVRSSQVATEAASVLEGNTLPAHLKAADFTLRDQNGHRVSLAHDRGHVVLLTFIHSLCKNDCPFMVEQIKGALNLLPHRGRGVRVIGVSAAPRQDTVHNRRWFLAQHEMSHRMEYLNGPLPVMRRIWKAYAVQRQTAHSEHSAFVFVISERGYERVGIPAIQLTPNLLVHDIRALERSPS